MQHRTVSGKVLYTSHNNESPLQILLTRSSTPPEALHSQPASTKQSVLPSGNLSLAIFSVISVRAQKQESSVFTSVHLNHPEDSDPQ